ncbi:MAG TPA: SRPBCC family protein [Ornithinibacter sp.]|nr:SRPBCC family protein [Ornithinibacter sp.]
MAFTISRRTSLAPHIAWSALTDLAEHTRHVPFTDVEVPASGLVLGTEVVAWTRLGRVAAADRMLVTALEPGRRLRLVKTGRFLHGWADITVHPDPDTPGGSSVVWSEELWLPGLRRLTRPIGDRLARVLFTRVVDGVLARARTPDDGAVA